MFKTAVHAVAGRPQETVFKIKIRSSLPGANSDVLTSLQKTFR